MVAAITWHDHDKQETPLKKLSLLCITAFATTLPALSLPAHGATKIATPAKTEAQPAANGKKPFVTVNGVSIPEIEARVILSDRMGAGATNSPELQNAVRSQLVVRELLARQARAQGFEKNEVLQTRVRMAKEEMLARAYEESYLSKHPVSDDDILKEYEVVKSRSGNKEFRVRHMLLASEDEAKSAIARLRGGEKFPEVATALSKDEGSRSRGGELGWLTPAAIQPPIAEVVVKLNKGQYTDQPVKGIVGWHVIQVDDQRPFTMPTLDDKVKLDLRRALSRRTLEAHLAELLKGAKIE